jgi:hypothetical protein
VGDNVTKIMFSGKFSGKFSKKNGVKSDRNDRNDRKRNRGRGSKFYRISASKPRLPLLHTGGGF